MPRIKSMIRPGSHWDEVHFSNHVMMDALAKHYQRRRMDKGVESPCVEDRSRSRFKRE